MNNKHIKNFISTFVFVSFYSESALASSVSLGEVSGNIHSTTSVIMQFMWAACIIVGVVLFFTALSQYQMHRRNPKLVPLTTVVTYLLLGLFALSIPFLERIFDFTDGATEDDVVEEQYYSYEDD